MKKILIINNNEDTMNLMKQFLKKHTYEAEYVYRTESNNVIEKVKEYEPDLVILEGSVGEEGPLCQRIKNNIDGYIPVILMAGNISSKKQQEDCGADDILPKPINPRLLLEKVKALLKTG